MSDLFKNLTAKQKSQLKMISIGLGVLVLVAFVAMVMGGGKKQDKLAPPHKKSDFSLVTNDIDKDVWMATKENDIRRLEQENQALKSVVESINQRLTEMSQQNLEKPKTKDSFMDTFRKKPQPPIPEVQQPSKLAPPSITPATEMPHPMPAATGFGGGGRAAGILPGSAGNSILAGTGNAPSAFLPSSSLDRVQGINVIPDAAPVKDNGGKSRSSKGATLPAGSFMGAVILNGIDAPTGLGEKSEPYPVMLSITDLSHLPNRWAMDLRECVAIGAGYGNLADERAYIRMEHMSCIRRSGESIDFSLKGHVVGEDGKLGLRGRLVSKQGQMIMKALLAGTMSGFANAFKPQQNVTLSLDGKTTAMPTSQEVFTQGTLGGLNTGLNRIADFFLKQAEGIFPVIEIGTGRHIEVMVLSSAEIPAPGASSETAGTVSGAVSGAVSGVSDKVSALTDKLPSLSRITSAVQGFTAAKGGSK